MSKIKVEKRKNGLTKGVSYQFEINKPILINDERANKGEGLVLLHNLKFDFKKTKLYVEGTTINNKEYYNKSVSSILSNEKISFMSNKDLKLFAKTLGDYTGLVFISKKISSQEKSILVLTSEADLFDNLSNNVNAKKIQDVYDKAYHKVVDKKEKDGKTTVEILDEEAFDEEVLDSYSNVEEYKKNHKELLDAFKKYLDFANNNGYDLVISEINYTDWGFGVVLEDHLNNKHLLDVLNENGALVIKNQNNEDILNEAILKELYPDLESNKIKELLDSLKIDKILDIEEDFDLDY